MRKLLLASATFSALIMPAMAADVAPYYRAPPLVWGWTGFYIGANAGWIGSSGNTLTNTGTDTGGGSGLGSVAGFIPGSIGLGDSGFIGGGQIGYNWQIGPNWVWGIETDFAGTSAKASTTVGFPGVATVYSRELDTLGTLRGRLGFLLIPNLLWYATGGLAYGETKIGSALICATCTPPTGTQPGTANQSSFTSVGWTLGAGVEWKFAPAWSVKAEYLYVDLGNQSNTLTFNYGANVSSLTTTINERDNIVRFGINYMFY
jgi:outer membrane immunogenic protein